MSLLGDFIQLRDEKVKLAEEYEQGKSYEMAYVALWSVTEHTVKQVEEHRKITDLRGKVAAWHYFFETETATKRPAPIKSFSCEVKNIPDIKLIQESLGSVPAITKLLQTKQKGKSSKYRDKRNAIAHQALKFGSDSVYLDYKATALAAIEELERTLEGLEEK
ncbi:hypothetical protein AB4354_22945 [Vibrio splendidus]